MFKYPLAVTIDTNIFDAAKFDLSDNSTIRLLENYVKKGKIKVILSEIVIRESKKHISNQVKSVCGIARHLRADALKISTEHLIDYIGLNEFLKIIDNKVGNFESQFKSEIHYINKRLDRVETGCSTNARVEHTKQFTDRIKLGPQIHKTLNFFRNRVNADHIFIGSFHNGNESITGIPYYKFDIIAERFRPDKVERDIEFAFMYKDADLLRHDLLPSELVQRGTVHYIIKEDGSSELEDIDNIIYRRMVGRDIKQLAMSVLRDPSGTPSGFVGCVRYDYEPIDLHELVECGRELEIDYAQNDKLISDNN